MLDTKARKYIDPIIDRIAKKIASLKISANAITFMSLVIGIIGAIFLYFRYAAVSIVLLWLSGFCDVLDGAVARLSGKKSMLGAQFDIVSDRIVELSYFWALALIRKESVFAIMFLITLAFISMTVFLTTGMISKNETKKSFYYQAGLMERTEGFLATTIMIILSHYLTILSLIYGILIFITIIQRIIETIRINSDSD